MTTTRKNMDPTFLASNTPWERRVSTPPPFRVRSSGVSKISIVLKMSTGRSSTPPPSAAAAAPSPPTTPSSYIAPFSTTPPRYRPWRWPIFSANARTHPPRCLRSRRLDPCWRRGRVVRGAPRTTGRALVCGRQRGGGAWTWRQSCSARPATTWPRRCRCWRDSSRSMKCFLRAGTISLWYLIWQECYRGGALNLSPRRPVSFRILCFRLVHAMVDGVPPVFVKSDTIF
mmetsp:Transcript_19793/g.44946  ORF Transcript_19793/g.44946 Transcript_19793/m.44946 type:complete len:229 (+) Transcript_19793:543-1229(+)